MLEIGTNVAGYRIDGIIGQGGMGVVYEATQLSLDRTIAVKLLAPNLSDDVAFRERFRREGLIQARIDHPHIITVHEAGESEHGLFLAMRLIRGPNVKDMIVGRQLDPARTLRVLKPIGEALDAAHESGLIHRDVKPQNILVGARDHAYLADFGLTKSSDARSLTKTGQFMGTLDYISPEQIQGLEATAASDTYSLAAVLYECLTGAVPFPKDSEAAVLFAHLSSPPPLVTAVRSDLPPALDDVIAKGMAKEPERRYESGSDLMQAAERAFTKRARAAMSAPVPVEIPEESGVRQPEAEIPTHEARSPASPDETHVGGPRTAPSSPVRSRRPTRPLVAIAGTALAGVVLAGFLTGRSGSEPDQGNPSSFASSSALELGFPGEWTRSSNRLAVPGLPLEDPVTLEGTRDAREQVEAGMSNATGASLLPRTFIRRLSGGAPAREDTVRLGDLEAYRYRDLRPRGSNRPLTLYVAPTTAGVATVTCAAPTSDCEEVATTLRLRRGRPFPIGPDPDYAKRMGAAIRTLDARRSARRQTLADAATQRGQARSVRPLVRAYAAAANDLARVAVSPAVRDVHRDLVDTARRIESGYERMAAATGNDRRGAYNEARRDVLRREQAFDRRLAALERFGYSIG